MIKRHLPVILALTIFAGLATAGAIKTWISGETLHSADLNANFAHIHNLMVGGHGARLVDADVNPTAAIAQSKIAGLTTALNNLNDAGVPQISNTVRAWGVFTTICGAPTCGEVLSGQNGITSVSNTATGVWTVTWAATRSDAGSYATNVTSYNNGNVLCVSDTMTATTMKVKCYTASTGAAISVPWSVSMYDTK